MALKVLDDALAEMDERQRRSLGNSIFHSYRLAVTHPLNPERSSIDQRADDLADRLKTAHPTTRERVRSRFVDIKTRHRAKAGKRPTRR